MGGCELAAVLEAGELEAGLLDAGAALEAGALELGLLVLGVACWVQAEATREMTTRTANTMVDTRFTVSLLKQECSSVAAGLD